MKKGKLKINGSILAIHIPITKEEMTAGLSNFNKLEDHEGMLFKFDNSEQIIMTTKRMSFPLDMIGLDKDFEVLLVKDAPVGEDAIIFPKNIKYILEVNKGIADKIGAQLFSKAELVENKEKPIFKQIGTKNKNGKTLSKKTVLTNKDAIHKIYNIKVEDIQPLPNHMQILGEGGEVLMNLKGGERIFSRIHTKELLDLAKDNDPKKLAKRMIEIIEIQNNTPPEYTT